ncbi:hypothetical protein [Nocardioides pakistanensis]
MSNSHLVLPTGFAEATTVDKHHFIIEVRRQRSHREPSDWFVIRNLGDLLDVDGAWRPESDLRDDADAFLFDEGSALRRAHAAVDARTLNGRTLAEREAEHARRRVGTARAPYCGSCGIHHDPPLHVI